MTHDQCTATINAGECLYAITVAMQDACDQIAKQIPPDKFDPSRMKFYEGLRDLMNIAYGEISRAQADMAEALSRANPPPSSMN